jgi:hypothetical protein
MEIIETSGGTEMNETEKLASQLLDLVTRCETRLIHNLSPKVQKQIDYKPFTWETIPEYLKPFWLEQADQILALLKKEGYVQLDRNQSLPKLKEPKVFSGEGLAEWEHANSYSYAQQDMLKAGFRKVKSIEQE